MTQMTYQCSGPRMTPEQRKEFEKALIALDKDIKKYGDAKDDPSWSARVMAAKVAQRNQLATMLADGRVPCPADMSAIINKLPWDGEVHEVQCPQCGITTTVRRVPA